MSRTQLEMLIGARVKCAHLVGPDRRIVIENVHSTDTGHDFPFRVMIY
jgi:hypothetical protein